MECSLEYALKQDREDSLKDYRNMFFIPKNGEEETIYFCGNSLGLQPKNVQGYIESELKVWRDSGVEGHFSGEKPWTTYHKFFRKPLGDLLGAKDSEIVVMNNLTVNLHLLMVSFYRPEKNKYKIMMEGNAFPSDQYTVETQLKFHGYDPDDSIIELFPRAGEHTLRNEDIIGAINQHATDLALILFSGVQYYSGQYFDIESITRAAHENGVIAGFDLAHAIGNVPLSLHNWNVDFATWCSYKYLNAGPGSVSGVYINEKHAKKTDLIRFGGWWGNDEHERFKMEKGFKPVPTADGWQLSNPSILSMAAHLASLELFQEVGLEALRQKSMALTRFLEYCLDDINSNKQFEILTPRDEQRRGAQLSILIPDKGRWVFEGLIKRGVVLDWREPDVIRVAPAPFYNTYTDIFKFCKYFEELINEHNKG